MKKKLLALLSATVLVLSSSMVAFATSPTVDTTETADQSQVTTTEIQVTKTAEEFAAETQVSEGFTVAPVTTTTVQAATVAVQNVLMNHVADLGTFVGDNEIVNASYDVNSKVTASVVSCVEINPSTAQKNADGTYTISMACPDIVAGESYVVLHYNGAAWEPIRPSISNGIVTFNTASCSPFALVKITVQKYESAAKTGDATFPVVAIVMVGAIAGAVVCGKKAFAK